MATKAALAKLARPTLTKPVQRERLFALLDSAAQHPVTWITAPGGSGKSTLVASYLDAQELPCIWYQCDEGDADLATFFYYMGLAAKLAAPRHRKPLPLLTPEYLAGVPTFTRRYFEILCSRLQPSPATDGRLPGFVIVLDNYQDVPTEAAFHDMIATALTSICADIHVVVLSRELPPPSLARLQSNGKIATLDNNDLRFTVDESSELMARRRPLPDPELVVRMHARTEGWVAGIILMQERAGLEWDGITSFADLASDRVFDYFAGELFNHKEKDIQEFLLKTAMLPMLSVSLAEKLTGLAAAGDILASLNRHHYFTEKLSGSGQDYRYHPLFREFLLSRAVSEFSADRVARLQRDAALLLEQSGQRDDAALLYAKSGDHDSLARMVACHGRELLLQGRSRTLAEWLACIPGEILDHDPWLLYWNGISSFPLDLPRSRSFLEKALTAFRADGDPSGCYLAWAAIVDTHVFGDEWKPLDDCLVDFDELQRSFPSFPTLDTELIVSSRMLLSLTLRKTDQPHRVELWLQRVTGLLQLKPSFDIQMDTVFCMSIYYLWRGEYDKNALLLERAAVEVRHRQPSPFALIRIKLMKGIHCWITAGYQEALQVLTEGLEISANSGVHIYDSLLWSFKAAAELAPGNLANAELALQQQLRSLLGMENALNVFFYHVNASWLALLCNNPSRAAGHLEAVSGQIERMGTPYYRALWHIGMAQAAFMQGRTGEATTLVRTAHRISLSMKSQVMEWYSLLLEAWFLLQDGMRSEGLLALHRGFGLGRRHGYLHLEFYQPAVMGFLCATALEERIEPEYVKGLIRKLHLAPPVTDSGVEPSAALLEEWPYPVKVYTLGRFEIIRDSEPLPFSGKEQKKPLELLKSLIAFGGRDVPEERLTDVLWPDADGDQARKSFETTLSRLRRLLGRDDVVTCRTRQLTINPLYCWVDSLALRHIFDRAQALADDQSVLSCEKALGLNKGAFLPADSALPWVLSSRETLKNRLLRIVLAAGRQNERVGEWEKASELYTKGIETDSLAEEFYRRLMICQKRLGNHADAVRSYKRCRSLLQSELGIEPSPETTAVYTAIIQQQ